MRSVGWLSGQVDSGSHILSENTGITVKIFGLYNFKQNVMIVAANTRNVKIELGFCEVEFAIIKIVQKKKIWKAKIKKCILAP